MPNYRLPPSLREHMVQQAKNLCDRRVALAHDDFPLTREDIQDAAMPPRVRAIVKGLIAEGMQTIQQTHTFNFVLRKDIHSIDRDTAISVYAKEPIFYFHEANRYSYGDSTLKNKNIDVDISWLPQEKLAALSKWVNNAVKENRMREVTMSTVKWFLEDSAPVPHITAAHIMARWPTIATLATEKYHRERFRDVPANLNRWSWAFPQDPVREKYRKAMRLADMVLTSAQMMPVQRHPEKPEVSSISIWEKFPGEKF